MNLIDYPNFLSENEIKEIEKTIFSLRPYWKNMLEYPHYVERKRILSSDFSKNMLSYIKKKFISQEVEYTDELIANISEYFIKYFNIAKVDILRNKDFFIKIFDIIKKSEYVDISLIEKILFQICTIDRCQNMLGDAIYLLGSGDENSKKSNINWEVQDILKKEFEYLHNKTCNSISSIFGVNCELDNTLPCPGFHIFGLCESVKCEYHYHQDVSILDYYQDVDPEKIYSFVSLIKSTSDGSHIEFGDYNLKKYYKFGTLHFWKGLQNHRIGTFSLKDNEFRITYQGHMYFDEKNKTYKMYF